MIRSGCVGAGCRGIHHEPRVLSRTAHDVELHQCQSVTPLCAGLLEGGKLFHKAIGSLLLNERPERLGVLARPEPVSVAESEVGFNGPLVETVGAKTVLEVGMEWSTPAGTPSNREGNKVASMSRAMVLSWPKADKQ